MARTSIILGGVSLLLLAFILFFERGTLSTHEIEGRKGRILATFVRERVTRIELQRKGVTTVLTRAEFDPANPLETGGYRVEQPFKAEADRDAVENLTSALEWIDPRRSLGKASEKDRASFGLDKPRYRLAYVAGRERRSFVIGAPSSDGAGAYLLTPDDGLAYVVGKELIDALDREPNEFHTKELHDGLSAYTVETLSVRSADSERALAKRDGLFWLEKPAPALASEPAVTELVNVLDGLRAARFITDKPGKLSDYGLDAPRLTLTVDSREYDPEAKPTDKDKKPKLSHFELRVGKPCAGHAGESFVRAGEGAVSCAADAELTKLQTAAVDLREHRLLALEDGAIRSVEIRQGKQRLSLEEQGEHGSEHGYKLFEGERQLREGKVDETALSAWWKGLRELRAESFEPVGATDLDGSVTLTFGRGKDEPAYSVSLRQVGERIAARRAGEASIAYYPLRALELVSISVARFRKPQLLSESDAKLTKLTVTADGRETETLTKRGERYTLSAGGLGPELARLSDADSERPTVDEIARLLSKLEALRFVTDAPKPEHGLNHPAYTLRAEYEGGTSHVLKLGATTEGGRYAQLDSDPNVFVVAQALVRQIDGPLLSRSALAVPLEEIAWFELRAGDKRVRITANAAGGFEQSGSERPADTERAGRLARALAGLRAARVTDYGKPRSDEPIEPAQLRVEIRVKPAGRPEHTRTLTFGSPASSAPEAEIFARASDLPATFALPNSALDALRLDASAKSRE